MKNFIKINSLHQQIDFYQKKKGVVDRKEWIDRHGSEAIFTKFLDLYAECDYSFVEISLPCWPHTVLYEDTIYK